MKMKYLALILISFTAACKSGPSTANAPEQETQQPANTASDKPNPSQTLSPFYCEELAEVEDLEDTSVFKPTTILSYEQVKNCVCIKYQYSGCHEGHRLLVWNGSWNESNRPEVNMELLVRDAGLCDQLLTDSACFSMKRMKLVGNEVLVFFNEESNNILLDFNY